MPARRSSHIWRSTAQRTSWLRGVGGGVERPRAHKSMRRGPQKARRAPPVMPCVRRVTYAGLFQAVGDDRCADGGQRLVTLIV
jgi:hypothetical protein